MKGRLAWYRNDGNGSFSPQLVIDKTNKLKPSFVSVADVDNDVSTETLI